MCRPTVPPFSSNSCKYYYRASGNWLGSWSVGKPTQVDGQDKVLVFVWKIFSNEDKSWSWSKKTVVDELWDHRAITQHCCGCSGRHMVTISSLRAPTRLIGTIHRQKLLCGKFAFPPGRVPAMPDFPLKKERRHGIETLDLPNNYFKTHLFLPHSGPTCNFNLIWNLACLEHASWATKWLYYWVEIHPLTRLTWNL